MVSLRSEQLTPKILKLYLDSRIFGFLLMERSQGSFLFGKLWGTEALLQDEFGNGEIYRSCDL